LKYNQVNLNIKKTCIHEIESAPDSVKEHPACVDIYNYYLSDIKPKKLSRKPAVKPIEKPKEKPVKDMSALSDDAKVIYQYIQDNKISDRLTISLSDDALNSLCKEFDLEFMKEVVLTLYQHYNRHAHQKTVPYKDERLAIRKWVVKAVKQDGLLPIVNAEYERHKGNVLLKDDEYNMLLEMCINKDELSQFITKYSEYKRNRQDISLDHDADNLYDWIKRDKGRNN